jgi:hypothetical protein
MAISILKGSNNQLSCRHDKNYIRVDIVNRTSTKVKKT